MRLLGMAHCVHDAVLGDRKDGLALPDIRQVEQLSDDRVPALLLASEDEPEVVALNNQEDQLRTGLDGGAALIHLFKESALAEVIARLTDPLEFLARRVGVDLDNAMGDDIELIPLRPFLDDRLVWSVVLLRCDLKEVSGVPDCQVLEDVDRGEEIKSLEEL